MGLINDVLQAVFGKPDKTARPEGKQAIPSTNGAAIAALFVTRYGARVVHK